jgi:alkaline phosphatase
MIRIQRLVLGLAFVAGLLLAAGPGPATPRNVILLIGDGMGVGLVTAAGLRSGAPTHMERMSVTGLLRTATSETLPIDSAAGGTALATGVSVPNGRVSTRADGAVLPTILEKARAAGKATGLVTSGSLTQAPAACFAAHVANRSAEKEIAAQLLDSRLDLLLGGGRRHFPEPQGWRLSGGIEQVGTLARGRTLGFFERPEVGQPAEPGSYLTTSGLVQGALGFLASAKKGFFLVVVHDQIDHAGHKQLPEEGLRHVLELDAAAGICRRFVQESKDTLVVVSADHDTGNLTLERGVPSQRQVTLSYSTSRHTGNPVPVYAEGPGSIGFTGTYDQTELPRRILRAAGVER